MTRETKTVEAAEIRFADGQEGKFTGYASIWDTPDSFGDVIRKGAFAKTIRENRAHGGPAMFLNHDPSEPVGVYDELVEDQRGLKVTGHLVETTKGRDVLTLLRAKALTGLSIGFRARSSERGANGGRILIDIDLVEVSLVSLPASRRARVTSVKATDGTAGIDEFVRAARLAAFTLRGTR